MEDQTFLSAFSFEIVDIENVQSAPASDYQITNPQDNAVPVVQSNVSSVPNDAYMMILNDMVEQSAQCVSVTTQNNVVDKSLTAELATYKEQVEMYERLDKFELTEREQKIDEQLRIVITNHNIKEEILKRELHSIKPQFNSTIIHNKSMLEEDVLKMIAKALKEQTPASIPIKTLTVYPPNTPATLVPRVLPTKRERGFEQTKECYLTKVIPFFKTLKEHFKGIQKALNKEIKEIKEIFEELEDEVDQNIVNRKYDEIERKNLLIANDNLIAYGFQRRVFIVQQILEAHCNQDSLKCMMPTNCLFKARCPET
ncbi:hypothetical protein Tco_1252485 [Tanacetum coccineum]